MQSDSPHDPGTTPDQLWRSLCATEYGIHLVGHDRREQWATELADRLSRDVAVSPAVLRSHASEAAWRHGQDPGSDYDPDRYFTPVWSELAAEENVSERDHLAASDVEWFTLRAQDEGRAR